MSRLGPAQIAAAVALLLGLLAGCADGPSLRTETGPVLAANFADPFVLPIRSGFLAFATNSSGINVQVAWSDDLRHWRLESTGPGEGGPQRDALAVLPGWVGRSRAGHVDLWAPEVARAGGRWVLYFSARSATARRPDGDARECIGAAVSGRPDRDYVAQPTPLICGAFLEGVIDPSPFRDADGRLYLDFKSDGNCCGRRTSLYAQPLRPDGLATSGPAAAMGVANDQPWEGEVVEAPTMVRRNGRYVLFFSGGDYGSGGYAVGYALCSTALGPCQQAEENPILHTVSGGLIGPGHQSVFAVRGRTFLAYHAWSVVQAGGQGTSRQLHFSELAWNGTRPQVLTDRPPASAAAPTVSGRR